MNLITKLLPIQNCCQCYHAGIMEVRNRRPIVASIVCLHPDGNNRRVCAMADGFETTPIPSWCPLDDPVKPKQEPPTAPSDVPVVW